jgi:hypothetical protein
MEQARTAVSGGTRWFTEILENYHNTARRHNQEDLRIGVTGASSVMEIIKASQVIPEIRNSTVLHFQINSFIHALCTSSRPNAYSHFNSYSHYTVANM